MSANNLCKDLSRYRLGNNSKHDIRDDKIVGNIMNQIVDVTVSSDLHELANEDDVQEDEKGSPIGDNKDVRVNDDRFLENENLRRPCVSERSKPVKGKSLLAEMFSVDKLNEHNKKVRKQKDSFEFGEEIKEDTRSSSDIERERKGIIKLMSHRNTPNLVTGLWNAATEKKIWSDVDREESDTLPRYESNQNNRNRNSRSFVSRAVQTDDEQKPLSEDSKTLNQNCKKENINNRERYEYSLDQKQEFHKKNPVIKSKINQKKPPIYPKPFFLKDRSKNATLPAMLRSPVNIVRTSSFRQNFIDQEIREAAEREEKWKEEKAADIALGSSVYTEAGRRTPDVEFQTSVNTQENQNTEPNDVSNEFAKMNGENADEVKDNHFDSIPDAKSHGINGITEVDSQTSLSSPRTQEYKHKVHSPVSPRSTLLLSPKGWGTTSFTVKPVSSTFSPTKINRFPSNTLPRNYQSQKNSGNKVETFEKHEPSRNEIQNHTKPVPTFEIVSSIKKPQTVIQMEMREAEKRENEWRLREIGLDDPNLDSAAPVDKPKPVRRRDRPKSQTVGRRIDDDNKSHDIDRKQINFFQFNSDSEPSDTIKLGDTVDAPVVRMRTNSSAEYKKNAVVRANRVSKRRSTLAERWESGEFFNNHD